MEHSRSIRPQGMDYYSDVIPAQAGIQGLEEGVGRGDSCEAVVILVVQDRLIGVLDSRLRGNDVVLERLS